MTRVAEFHGEILPAFIPSVSSVKDDRPFSAHIALIEALGLPVALTSAYDWHSATGARDESLSRYFDWRAAGGRMVLDSGKYEAYWHHYGTWSHEAFLSVALELTPTWVMSFDNPEVAADAGKQARLSIEEWERDQRALGRVPVVPIVHGLPETLAEAVERVARDTSSELIAIAERDLGEGILARVRTVRDIRRRLDDTSLARGLHVLGTGSPLSVLVYTLAGADSYDGLEWNRTSVDHETARLYHLQHFDLFEYQSPAGGPGSYFARALAHNLLFWRDWMMRIRRGEGRSMLRVYLPPVARDLLEKVLEEPL